MKQMPQVQKYMTPMPQTIGRNIDLKTALSIMREQRIRHLPVQESGKLVGVLTDRDLKFASSFTDSQDLTVDEVMNSNPYSVTPETALDKVVFEMAEHKYGCVVIQQKNGKVVGIFTAVDGMRVLGETLEAFYKPGPDCCTPIRKRA